MTHAADAILYVTQDHRLFKNGDSPPWDIRHLPGHDQWDNPNRGTDCPFSIKHIDGPEPCKTFNSSGDRNPFKITHLPRK
jgi:hypothetical protein